VSNLSKAVLDAENILREELEAQGHVAFGNLLNSIAGKVEKEASYLDVSFYALDYAFDVNNELPAARVGFVPLDGNFREWIQLRFSTSDEKEIKAIYFAIHKTWMKEGKPSRGSYSYSNNGKRTDWITDTESKIVESIGNAAAADFGNEVDVVLSKD